ncbi:hypothetical protein L208DRAFT_1382749 [Tricholoma matsutake]|nr:hypothetical protein L208DRAFT_1382749 [Tricholoma matsutake 945]
MEKEGATKSVGADMDSVGDRMDSGVAQVSGKLCDDMNTKADEDEDVGALENVWTDYVKEIGQSKAGHMMMAEDLIISKFDKYWDDFTPFISEIIQACFPSGKLIPNSLTHLKMLEILTRAQQVVHDDEPISGVLDRTK